MIDKLQKNIFTTVGRLNRLRYLKYSFILGVSTFVVNFIVAFFILLIFDNPSETFKDLAMFLVSIPIAIGQLMLTIRRLHDLNKTGYFCLLDLIPIINVLFEIYLIFFKGTDGPNQYGDDPLQMY